MSIRIKLEWFEVAMSTHVGWMRQLNAMKNGSKPTADCPKGWTGALEGAAGEMAAAKAIGCYWDGSIDTFKAPDLLDDIQVRTRLVVPPLPQKGSRAPAYELELYVRPEDSDDHRWVLVVGECPNFEVIGWILGRDAKRKEWLHSYGGRPPAYFVPRNMMHPMETLTR